MSRDIITERDRDVAKFTKALGHPARLAIMRMLIDKGRCCPQCHPCICGDNCQGESCKCGCRCGTLVEQFSMSQSTVSQHIKELKTVGLITSNSRKGDYTLNHKKLSEGLISLLDLLGIKNFKTMEDLMKCNCNENCTCGDNCTCGPECNCGPDCHCGDN